MPSRIQRELAFLLTGKDVSATRAMRGVRGEITALERHSGKAFRSMTGNIERGIVIGAGAAAGAIGYAVKLAGDFQAGMQTVNTVALATPAVLQKAGEGIRQIFRDTGQPLDDLQAAEYDLVSAGIKLQSANDGLRQSVELGRGAYGSTAEAVDVLTTAVNSYNLKAKDGSVATSTWTRISDELAQAVADGKVKLSDIASTYAQVAPLAAQAGIGTDEVAAALGFLTAKGNSAGETLTQMSRAIIELQKPNADLVALQKKVGKNYAEIAKQKGLHVALQQMRDDAKKQGVAFIDLFGRIEGYKYALQTTGPNARGFADELDRIRHSAGMTQKQFDERNQGLNYQLGVLKANIDDAAITIGTSLLPQFTELAKEGTDWLQGHQPEIKQFGQDLADGIRSAVEWARKLDWDKIGKALEAGATAAGGIASAIASLDPTVLETLASLFVANKFTGGALGDIGGDILGGLAKGFVLKSMGVQAGVVNVSGGVVNGGGVPGVGGAAGAAGAAGGIAPELAPMGLAAFGGTALFGAGLAGVVSGAEQAITDGLAGMFKGQTVNGVDLGDLMKTSGDRARESTPVGAIGDFVRDPGGTVGKTADAINQLTTFMNRPHPDFLGDLGQLLNATYHPDQQPQFTPEQTQAAQNNYRAGERDSAGGSVPWKLAASAAGSTKAVQSMSQQLARLLEKLHTANRQGRTGEAADLRAHAIALKAKIDAAAQMQAAKIAAETAAVHEGERSASVGLSTVSSATRTGTAGTTGAVNLSTTRIVGAIQSNRPITNVEVRAYATAVDVHSTSTTHASYGPPISSHTDNRNGKGQ